MMPEFVVYIKPTGCHLCEEAIELLQLFGKTFIVVKLGVDMSMEDFKTSYPYIRAAPLITTTKREFTGPRGLRAFLTGTEVK